MTEVFSEMKLSSKREFAKNILISAKLLAVQMIVNNTLMLDF
mgnify:FL=1